MNKIYKLKEGTDLNKLAEMGYEIVSPNPFILCKIVEQPLDGELVQGSLNNIYNTQEYMVKFYGPNRKKLTNMLGLTYRNGKARMTEKFKRCLQDWRIQIEPYADGWLGFASADPCENKVYYSYKYMEQYCADELKALQDAELVELIEVEDEAQ